MSVLRRISVAVLFYAFASSINAEAQPLTVDEFLHEVTRSNEGYRSAREESLGAYAAVDSAKLLFKPQAFVKLEYLDDTRDTPAPLIQGTESIQRNYSFGIREQTPWGMQFQVSFEASKNALIGTDPRFVTRPEYSNVYPVPLFRISLWENFMGREDRANQRLQQAQTLAQSFGKAFQARTILVEAEGRYWRLAATREAIRLQQASVERARSLLELQRQQRSKHLIDEADLLLGESALQGKELELVSMKGEERSAARAFNAARGIDSDEVDEDLDFPAPQSLKALEPPARRGPRGDVKVAEEQSIATAAGSEVARQKLLPSLSLYGSIFAYGLELTVPLDQGAVHTARDGYARQIEATDLNYHRRVFDDESDWKDLSRKFEDSQKRLALAVKFEEIQRRKYEAIRARRQRGLTIAFQVYQYELDYLGAALARVQIEGTLLGVRAQMKLYEGDES